MSQPKKGKINNISKFGIIPQIPKKVIIFKFKIGSQFLRLKNKFLLDEISDHHQQDITDNDIEKRWRQSSV